MSLVITTVSRDSVVQVSETRLSSLRDRSPLCDDQRKSIVVVGKYTRFVLGWVGLAREPKYSKHDTGQWLREALCAIDAVELPIDRIAAALTGLATQHFGSLPLSAKDKRCQFVLGGWSTASGQQTPFTYVIYNDLIFNGASEDRGQQVLTASGTAAPHFMYSISSFTPIKRPFLVTVIGDFDATSLMVHFRGLRGLLKRRTESRAISAVCRQIVLEAARRRQSTVGKILLGVEMNSEGSTWCSYYNEQGDEELLVPDMLTERGFVANASVRPRVVGDELKIRVHAQVARRAR